MINIRHYEFLVRYRSLVIAPWLPCTRYIYIESSRALLRKPTLRKNIYFNEGNINPATLIVLIYFASVKRIQPDYSIKNSQLIKNKNRFI